MKGLGYSDRIANRAVNTFKAHDERRLIEDYKLASDVEKLQERARSSNAMLEKLFREDEIEEAKLAQTESNQREAKAATRTEGQGLMGNRCRPSVTHGPRTPRSGNARLLPCMKARGEVDGVSIPR